MGRCWCDAARPIGHGRSRAPRPTFSYDSNSFVLAKIMLIECVCLQVSFVPEISANYGLSIMVQGIQIQGSPFKVRVRNDETIASHCRLFGPNVAMGVAGERNTFFIQGAPAPRQE